MPKILGTPDDLEVSDNVTIKTDTARIKIPGLKFDVSSTMVEE